MRSEHFDRGTIDLFSKCADIGSKGWVSACKSVEITVYTKYLNARENTYSVFELLVQLSQIVDWRQFETINCDHYARLPIIYNSYSIKGRQRVSVFNQS